MTRKKDPTEKLKDHSAASPEIVEDSVDTEQDRKVREDFLKRIAALHDDLVDLAEDSYGSQAEDVNDFARSLLKQVRVGPFGNVGGTDNRSPHGDD